MGKPCLLPERHADKVELLEATPPEVLNTAERYAVYLAGINRRNPEGQQRSFSDIAKETNRLFQSVGKEAFTPQKLSKFLNSHAVDDVIAGVEQDMAQRSALTKEPEAALEELAQESQNDRAAIREELSEVTSEPNLHDQRPELQAQDSVSAEPLQPPLPAPSPAVEAEEVAAATSAGAPVPLEADEERRPDLLLEPNVLRGTLQFVEFLAHETGDERLSGELHETIERMVGRGYTNPLIASSQELDKALVRHNTAVRELPATIAQSVQKGTQAVQDALTARAIRDKAALHEAIGEPVQQAWKAVSDMTGEATSAISHKTSAISNLFKSARAVASAAVEVLNDARKDGGALDQTTAMQALQGHLRQRD